MNTHTRVTVKSSEQTPPAGLDIFVFKDGAVKVLDSYSKVHPGSDSSANVVSGRGDRIVVMMSGSHLRADQIASIRCYEDLESLYVSMEDEEAGNLLMSGETVICAGEAGPWNIVLEPLLSKVEVLGLSVKLKGG